jgi:hypothetical protein
VIYLKFLSLIHICLFLRKFYADGIYAKYGEAGPVWRVSIESPQTGECHRFTSMEALRDFLRQCIELGALSSLPPTQEDYAGGK